MKKVIISLCLSLFCLSCFADENQRYKGMYFSPIQTDLYKRPVITYKNHDKIVDYHAGAVKLCNSLGMRLPKKDESDLLVDYLKLYHKDLRGTHEFWLYDNAVGKVNPEYFKTDKNTTSSAYVLYYFGIYNPVASDIGPLNKTCGNASTVRAICIKEAPPMTFNERLELFKNDFYSYQNGGGSFYGMTLYELKNISLINYKINKQYLEKVKSNLDEIIALEYDQENYQFKTLSVTLEDEKKLNDKTIKIINIYNELIQSDDL